MRQRVSAGVMVVMLLLVLILDTRGGLAAKPAQHKIHPALLRLAQERAAETVEVIVQVQPGHKLRDKDLPPGVRHQRDLDFAGMQVVELPAAAAADVANHPDVVYISPNAPVRVTAVYTPVTTYPATTGVTPRVWGSGHAGQGIGVAVLDSGVSEHPDLKDRHQGTVVQGAELGDGDAYGHGTHVAGIIAGASKDGRYVGMAPKAKVYNVKITNNSGQARESDLLAGLEWVFYNHHRYGIQVVNISSQSTLAQSYLTAPLSAGVEQLWRLGIVVVVAGGNRGAGPDAMHYPPANDPFVITVGALGDRGTPDRADDVVPDWTSRGLTQDGHLKPDVLAPGHRIVAPLAPGSYLERQLPDRVEDSRYIRLSGTSMAAPMVSGLVADILSYRRNLTPDQIKWLIQSQTYGASQPGMLDADRIWAFLEQTRDTSAIPAVNQNLVLNNYLNPAAGGLSGNNVFFDNVFFDNVFFDNVYFENVYFENMFLD